MIHQNNNNIIEPKFHRMLIHMEATVEEKNAKPINYERGESIEANVVIPNLLQCASLIARRYAYAVLLPRDATRYGTKGLAHLASLIIPLPIYVIRFFNEGLESKTPVSSSDTYKIGWKERFPRNLHENISSFDREMKSMEIPIVPSLVFSYRHGGKPIEGWFLTGAKESG